MGNNEIDTAPPLKAKNWTSRLSGAVRSAFARGNSLPLLVRVGVPVENLDPWSWLSSCPGPDRVVWQSRHHNTIRATCGSVVTVSGDNGTDSSRLNDVLDGILSRPGDDMRFFGGMRFDAAREKDLLWQSFGGYRFILPRFELLVRGSNAQIYCNLIFPEDTNRLESILQEVNTLDQNISAFSDDLPIPSSRTDSPGKAEWVDRIDWALDQFVPGVFEKVVLARRTDYEFPRDVNAFQLLQILSRSTPSCFHFYVESPDGKAFIGASPERLFYRNGLQIDSEAVAGTRPRGETEDVDEEYRTSLLASEKDQREHAYVRDSIESALKYYCESITVDHEASEMRLARGRHLVSRISGVLSRPVSAFELLDVLHPTSAVGGHPTETAVQAIRGTESFDRGWYAGPVGWIGRDTSEFAVALRCGVVDGSMLSLFSGAGIVDGSQPELEWDEIEQKIIDFVNVIGLDLREAK